MLPKFCFCCHLQTEEVLKLKNEFGKALPESKVEGSNLAAPLSWSKIRFSRGSCLEIKPFNFMLVKDLIFVIHKCYTIYVSVINPNVMYIIIES